ncbi:BPL-N domain-containing protein [Kutzneria viridogrisea]|uniref:Biotin-protein ligase N-terminal domain-containing protein n=2 Tax=Kutzneria TaxID=43356 RepID=W5WC61_9PSEU|nr:BPL-N domain-containing protein [Kutzneria albida]AHH98492.1 hypothetical protein KALB_5130 [Kutzneria albida DSM 43870]MBA8923923.1 glutamine amidotransferase-like uncharacterized protein [Kutzneria viridogrisea]
MRALVYRGPASLPGCPEAVAELLASSSWDFEVRYTGPKEKLKLTPETLGSATVYAQPGGGELEDAYPHLRKQRGAIREFVRAGGRYLGFCLGGYLAGATPGFGLLPGDTDQYIASRKASLDTDESTLVQVRWRGHKRVLFFQDGPHFLLERGAPGTVLATYRNKTVAALVTPFGQGRVGVVGPHPEATEDWFTDIGLDTPDRLGVDLGHDLVDAVMAP